MLFRHLIRTCFIVLAALSAFTAYAQETEVATTPAMWVVENGDSRVYLLGSMHALPSDVYPMPTEIEAAYLDADVVVFEVDLDDVSALQSAVFQYGMMPEGLTFSDVAGNYLLLRTAKLLESMFIPVEAIELMQPWVLATIVSSLDAESIGLYGETGLDAHFMERAMADGKEIGTLETIEEQLQMFASMSMEQQVDFLEKSLDDMEGSRKTLAMMLHAWRTGDMELLLAITDAGMKDYPDLREPLLDNRNRAWIPQIVEYLAKPGQTTLVIVGAAHLIGTVSVIELLEELGYEVQRL